MVCSVIVSKVLSQFAESFGECSTRSSGQGVTTIATMGSQCGRILAVLHTVCVHAYMISAFVSVSIIKAL